MSAAPLEDLVAAHDKRLYGFFRSRVHDDGAARDLAQDTWVEVWQRGHTYDPERGSFWTFVRIWADIVLKRFWSDRPLGAALLLLDADERDGEPALALALAAPGHPLDDALALARTLLELLARAAACSRPPHEVIVFGFSKLSWKPAEIVAELANGTLEELAGRLEVDYAAVVGAPRQVHVALCPLRGKLDFTLLQVISDPRTRRLFPALLDLRTGTTRLGDYLGTSQAAQALVTRCWDSVKRAVFAQLARGGGELADWLAAEGGDAG